MSASILPEGDPTFQYLLWRTVKAKGGGSGGVKSVDAAAAEREAARQHALIRKTLEHPESGDMMIEPQTVEEAIAAIMAEYRDEKSFDAELSAWGLSRSTLAQAIEAETRAGLLLDRVIADVSISEEEVSDYYQRNRERMLRPETRRVRHLLITVNGQFPENSADNARIRMENLRRELEEEPGRFGELALRHSECPSAVESGLVGEVPKGRLYPELDEALFTLEEGQVSDVIVTALGYHLILCEKIEPERFVPFNEAAPKIRKALVERKQKRRVREWIADVPLPSHAQSE